jgi:hypothetical protein
VQMKTRIRSAPWPIERCCPTDSLVCSLDVLTMVTTSAVRVRPTRCRVVVALTVGSGSFRHDDEGHSFLWLVMERYKSNLMMKACLPSKIWKK